MSRYKEWILKGIILWNISRTRPCSNKELFPSFFHSLGKWKGLPLFLDKFLTRYDYYRYFSRTRDCFSDTLAVFGLFSTIIVNTWFEIIYLKANGNKNLTQNLVKLFTGNRCNRTMTRKIDDNCRSTMTSTSLLLIIIV